MTRNIILTPFWAWATFSLIAIADQAIPKIAHATLEAEK